MTWVALLCGASWGFLVVYTPGLTDVFVMSSGLNPIYLGIPCAFGLSLLIYSAIRRIVMIQVRKYRLKKAGASNV